MADQAIRWIRMLELIPKDGGVTTAQLRTRLAAMGFNMELRSIQRDLERLSADVGLRCDDSTKPYKWSWVTGARRITIPMLTDSEALSFYLVEKNLSLLLPEDVLLDLKPYFESARSRLAAPTTGKSLRAWASFVRVIPPVQPLLQAKIPPGVRNVMIDALIRATQVMIVYKGRGKERSVRRQVHPLGMIQHGAVTYLAVRFEEHDDPRLISMHRISSAQALESRAEPPISFDLDKWIDQGALGFGQIGKSILLEVCFFKRAGDHLLETPLSRDQQVVRYENGDLSVKATVFHTRQLTWWLQSFGRYVRVNGPPPLVQEMRQTAMDTVDLYRD